MTSNTVASPVEVRFRSGGLELFGKSWFAGSAKPTVLLLHGLGFYSFEYDELAPLLASAGLSCFAFDFRGHGHSQGTRGHWRLAELVDDARCALDFVRQREGGPIGVFGNSLGALVGVHLAASDGAIGSLVACGCPTRVADFGVTPWRKLLLRLLNCVGRVIPVRVSINWVEPYRDILARPETIRRVAVDPLITDARRFAPSTYDDIFGWNALDVIDRVAAPLLVIAATEDGLQPVAQSELLFDAARCPRELRLIQTGHVPNLENAALLAPLLEDWFRRTLR